MFNGQKLQAFQKRIIGQLVGFTPNTLEDDCISMTGLINLIDRWAESYGYEYHSMTHDFVVFKRVGV